jgi:hypothetical protein
VLAAPHQRTSAFKEPYKHCGRTNHSSDTCFAKHPEKLVEFHARRAARGRGTSSTPRGSAGGTVSVAASSTISATSSWVLDSGASFHVTSNQFQLVACKPVIEVLLFRQLMVLLAISLIMVYFAIIIFLYPMFLLCLSCL